MKKNLLQFALILTVFITAKGVTYPLTAENIAYLKAQHSRMLCQAVDNAVKNNINLSNNDQADLIVSTLLARDMKATKQPFIVKN